jgi:putative Mg2+ transporter-C (MgtC) family protein
MIDELLHTDTTLEQILLRLAAAVVFGGIIGYERELKERPAGLRTNMMVALAAALFTLLMHELVAIAPDAGDHVRIDTLRIIEAVIAGVAFLGAGAILRSGNQIGGLTTGATLWMSGALGVAAGGGFIMLAAIGVVFAFVVLTLVGRFEAHVLNTKPAPSEPAPPED